MTYLPTLRLFFAGGVCNDYRLREDCVELRTDRGTWRVLSDSDLELHFRFNTDVARWLRRFWLGASVYARLA
jgi:hypothetical protein